jgi:hypothetical protein
MPILSKRKELSSFRTTQSIYTLNVQDLKRHNEMLVNVNRLKRYGKQYANSYRRKN